MWILPATATDGTPLTGANALTKVQLFAAQAKIADTFTGAPTAELPGNATSYVYTATVPNGSTLYFRLKACTAQACSAFSTEASNAVKIAVPAVPTGISVTVTVTLTTP